MSGQAIVRIAIGQLGNDDDDCSGGCYSAHGGNWCSEFVSWVYNEAGEPFTGGRRLWLLTNTAQICDWFFQRERLVDRDDSHWDVFVPSPGDYVYIGRVGDPDRKHSGLVERVSGGNLHTLEGNNAGRPVARYVYPDFRTNVTDNGPAATNGYVLAFGAKHGRVLRGANGAQQARLHFQCAFQNAVARRFTADLSVVRMVLQQVAAGLAAMPRGAASRMHMESALRNAATNASGDELGVIVLVLQLIAAGLSAGASGSAARAHFDAATALAFSRRFNADLESVRTILGRLAAGLARQARTPLVQLEFEMAMRNAAAGTADLASLLLVLQQIAGGLNANLRSRAA